MNNNTTIPANVRAYRAGVERVQREHFANIDHIKRCGYDIDARLTVARAQYEAVIHSLRATHHVPPGGL